VPAATCALTAGWAASALPFFPAGWPPGIAAAAAALGFAAPRLGLAFALGAAFFPLANLSVGLAIVYAALAAGWLALAWNDARAGLIAASGPLLAAAGAIGLLPLAAQLARGTVRRAAQAGTAVLLAALVAGLRHDRLPLDGSTPPLGLGIPGSARPGAVADAFWRELLAHPLLLAEAGVFALAAAALPHARGRGPWPAALFGASFMAATILLAPAAPAAALVAGAWLTAAALALEPTH
jgi:hypothetical protein